MFSDQFADFELDIWSSLEGSGVPLTVFSANRPAAYKKKVRGLYRSLTSARELSKLLDLVVKRGLTWESSYGIRDEILSRFGFHSYGDYLDSMYWGNVRGTYLKSSLLQSCAICGNRNFVLHHCGYRYLVAEDISKLVPLCSPHHRKLHRFLMDHAIPLEYSLRALAFVMRDNHVRKNNRRMYRFRRNLLQYKLEQMGYNGEFSRLSVFGKKSKRIDRMLIKVQRNKKVKNFMYDIPKGVIHARLNGRCFDFQYFCDHLSRFLKSPGIGYDIGETAVKAIVEKNL